MKNLHLCLCLWAMASMNILYGQCPTTSCTNHQTIISTAAIPECVNGTIELDGNIDNGSDCESPGGDNCWKFVFNRHDPVITGITLDIGKGNGVGCNGEVSVFYTEIDGVCTDHGSSGSQNFFTFDFGATGEISLWLCDNSSGEVSLCQLCSEIPAPAPVELISFQGKAMELTNMIEWSTASEEKSSHFVVEKSINGRSSFQELGSLASHHNSEITRSYEMVDRNPYPITYYRLISVDLDGSTEASDWVVVKRAKSIKGDRLHVFPLPLGKQPLQVYYEAVDEEPILITLTDINGRLLYSENKRLDRGMHNWSLDIPNFSEGLLVLKIHHRDGIQTSLIPRIVE